MTRVVCDNVMITRPWKSVQNALQYVVEFLGFTAEFKDYSQGEVRLKTRKFFKTFEYKFNYSVSTESDKTTITLFGKDGTLVIVFEKVSPNNVRICISWSGAHEFLFRGALNDFLENLKKALVEISRDPRYASENTGEAQRMEMFLDAKRFAKLIREENVLNCKITGNGRSGKTFEVIIKNGIVKEIKFCDKKESCSSLLIDMPANTMDVEPVKDLDIDDIYEILILPE